MNDKSNKSEDKYNIRWDINGLDSISATELTGLIPSAPTSDEEIESYNKIMTFSANDIVAKDYHEDKNQTLNAKKTGNNLNDKKK